MEGGRIQTLYKHFAPLGEESMTEKICVLGLGYIGLPTAGIFATHGFEVIGVDVDRAVVETLSGGDVHIKEPGLKTIVQAAIKSGNLSVKTNPEPADVFIIAVPTPITADKRADLRYVRSAAESIVPHLRRDNLVILESTCPPRTTTDVVMPILAKSGLTAGPDFSLAHSPERVLPGQILTELVKNDRVVGGIDRRSAERARGMYESFVEGGIWLTDVTTAEMVKLMENTYRDVNIALANEFAMLAEQIGVDVWEAIRLASRHPRVDILQPGPGVGGHCIAVDPWFLVEAAPEEARLIERARQVNDDMPAHVVELVEEATEGIENPVIAALGVTYKANVDDVRGSPAIEIIRQLLKKGCQVRACDPHVQGLPGESIPLFPLQSALRGADCLLLLVDHNKFKELSPQDVGPLMKRKLIVDTRRCLKYREWRMAGFKVIVLGSHSAVD
jgi:UDP-N-acetyl-D-mannosaminuronic acid dehydrogenase